MFIRKIILCSGFLILISSSVFAQKNSLIEYLTEVNLKMESKVLKEYCECSNKKGFIDAYNDVSVIVNKSINKNLVILSSLKAKKAIDEFYNINNSFNRFENSVKHTLDIFLAYDCSGSPEKGLFPTAISIAEFTGIANSIIGLVNQGKERQNARRDRLISILEGMKIPSIQGYECKSEKKD